MDSAPYDIRLARPDDIDKLRASVRRTLNNPEGKSGRKTFADALGRGELLVLARRERDGSDAVDGFIEWHSRVDGVVTIRDAGSAGDELNLGHVKRLVRELLRMARPPSATVKVDADLAAWNEVFAETAGFIREGQEYSRPKYKNIWTWTPQAEQIMLQRMRASQPGRPGSAAPRPAPPRMPPPGARRAPSPGQR